MEGMDLKLFFNNIILNKIYITILQKYLRKNGKIILNIICYISVFFEIEVKNMKFDDYSDLIPHPRNKTSTSLKLYLVYNLRDLLFMKIQNC